MFTRKNYLEKNCTYSEYYNQFINEDFINKVVITIGRQKIMESTDENLNDIKLAYWDQISPPLGTMEKMKELGDYLTLSGKVCIAKEAAKNFKLNQYSI
jgi:hypothetical protein